MKRPKTTTCDGCGAKVSVGNEEGYDYYTCESCGYGDFVPVFGQPRPIRLIER